jgi:hypothetical protein
VLVSSKKQDEQADEPTAFLDLLIVYASSSQLGMVFDVELLARTPRLSNQAISVPRLWVPFSVLEGTDSKICGHADKTSMRTATVLMVRRKAY